MRVQVTHTTRLDYSAEVVEGVLEARLGPFSDGHQTWRTFDLHARPNASLGRFTDGFGNTAHLVTLVRPHAYLEVVARSEVETLLADPFADPVHVPTPLKPAQLADYLPPSALVSADTTLEQLAAPFRPAAPEATFQAVRGLMQLVYETFTYEADVTSVATTVAEVVAERRGVCQDFTHVLIGLCRSLGIPARYVSGYIVTRELRQGQVLGTMVQSQAMQQGPSRGGGASHAWVEAFIPTHGWRGFDPTNNLVASEHHIKMAIGRDYRDVAPTRGTYRGRATERLSVDVQARASH